MDLLEYKDLDVIEEWRDKFEPLISYVEDINKNNHSTATSIMIIHKDKIALEYYYGNHSNDSNSRVITFDSQFNIASIRKTYIGLVVAYAIYEGKIKSLDDYVITYLRGYDLDVLKGVTIRHLLTHSHGLNEKENGIVYKEFKPGDKWAYRNINVKLINQIINNVYGESVAQIIKSKVLNSLNFKETDWRTRDDKKLVKVIGFPDNNPLSYLGKSDKGDEGNLFVSTRELAYWGYLHLKRGNINGDQVVPKEVIDLSTSLHNIEYKDENLPDNGFFWYVQKNGKKNSEIGEKVPRGSFQIVGITGTILLVIPAFELVIVKMSNKEYNYGGERYIDYIKKFGDLVVDLYSKERKF
ncbi:serine hydrolase domain-containing protein [Bacillus toyonensis]|uniref:serine hydrolase domain-containing protein n=1 Tax=Bacillus toyonensis TaxID=155322 RepID=UPI0018D05D25|nr:serine hydrolase domain-containing protein [Bacillus toyonensis]MBH0357118.1 penicillin-binding protein [Bacillus toyonensis biovar Thuringiensis]